MFGIGDMVKGVTDTVEDTVNEFVDDPVGFTVDTLTQPIRDSLEVLEGLTEGEIREMAILRLGADAITGMAVSEIAESLVESFE